MDDKLKGALDRASAVLGPESGAAQRQARAIMHEALMQAQQEILGHRKIEPITIDQIDTLDQIVANMALRKGRDLQISAAAEQAVAGEIVPGKGKAA